MKKVWLGSSWKMNKTHDEVGRYCQLIKPYLSNLSADLQTFLIPPFPYVKQVDATLNETRCLTGVQNVGWANCGPYTGEVSVDMAKDIGASLVEIGHSERREWFGETDATVNKKVILSLNANLKPLICVGDTADEKRWGVSAESIVRQVKIALHGVSADQVSKVLIAYEPVWAIGPGKRPPNSDYIGLITDFIKQTVENNFNVSLPVVYGGGLKAENAAMLADINQLDGGLIALTNFNQTICFQVYELSNILSLYTS